MQVSKAENNLEAFEANNHCFEDASLHDGCDCSCKRLRLIICGIVQRPNLHHATLIVD